jgi:hypothetical protein
MKLDQEIEKLDALGAEIASAGRELMTKCDGSIFPCDALAFTVLARSLNLVKGFGLLVGGRSYECAASLFRFQLDNVLRLFGVVTCNDPHGISSQVLNGVPLRKLTHSSGPNMTDRFLVELLGRKNKWLPEAYDVASGFVHLSEQHFQHMLMQSTSSPDGSREFTISDEDGHIPEEQKLALVHTFSSVTRGATDLVEQWTTIRDSFGSAEMLKARFLQLA